MQDKCAVQDWQSGQSLKYQRVRASLAPVGVFPRKGTNPSSKMVKCPLPYWKHMNCGNAPVAPI